MRKRERERCLQYFLIGVERINGEELIEKTLR
jgi:hypothetical protein